MERKRLIFGAACLAALLLMEAHSLACIELLRVSPPFVIDSAYFGNLDAYDGQKVFLEISSIGQEGDTVYFSNMTGERRELVLPQGMVFPEGRAIVEASWDASTGTLSGEPVYELRYTEERETLSLLGLIVLLLFFHRQLLSAAGFGRDKDA